MAQEVKIGPARYSVTVARADVSATTLASARRALDRIGRAATEHAAVPAAVSAK